MKTSVQIVGVLALALAVGLISFSAGRGNASKSVVPASTKHPEQEPVEVLKARADRAARGEASTPVAPQYAGSASPKAEPQPRSGGNLPAREMDAIRSETKLATAHQEEVEAKIKAWTAKDPGAKAIERLAVEIATFNASAVLRSTLLLRRIAIEHGLTFECFAGIVNEAGRKECGERLWAFDGKTGEIRLAPKDPPK